MEIDFLTIEDHTPGVIKDPIEIPKQLLIEYIEILEYVADQAHSKADFYNRDNYLKRVEECKEYIDTS